MPKGNTHTHMFLHFIVYDSVLFNQHIFSSSRANEFTVWGAKESKISNVKNISHIVTDKAIIFHML